jgi:lysophospholipase L1-like esterase
MAGFFAERETILFQGDSVTEGGRDRTDAQSLGQGYPLFVAAMLPVLRPSIDLTFINKGVAGDRVMDLEARWTEDCIALNPTVVSILIGINETWRRFDSGDRTPAGVFEWRYRVILERVKNELGAKIIILEPFLLHVYNEQRLWRDDLNAKIEAARRLAAEFGALYVALDGKFAAAATKKPPSFWAADGIHPTNAGHGLIADAWMRAVLADKQA